MVHLRENHPDFDGLTEAHFVGEERLAIHLEEGAVGRVDLMLEEFDGLFVEMGEGAKFCVGLAGP
ncbi:hypothetical protein GCM10028857_18640 [Salinarchaeum chitinilyticum]